MNIVLSPLSHTWILDLDGTILKHNGYKIDGIDTMLPGAREFIDQIPAEDMIIIVTSRNDESKELTLNYLKSHNIRYDHIIWNAPYGERIIVNDDKPSGLKTSIAINKNRDSKCDYSISINTLL